MRKKNILCVFLLVLIMVICMSTISCKNEKPKTVIDLYQDGYNTNMVVGFDSQGRTVNAVSSEIEKREVGLFYFLWLNELGGPFVNSRIIEQYGVYGLTQVDMPGISPANYYHWWDEPIYGFYNSSDEWVIRKHLELFALSSIDFVVFDVTNGPTYADAHMRILRIVDEMRQAGWDVPQVAFFTNTSSAGVINGLYSSIYSQNLYPESWYRIDGKPLIIGSVEPGSDELSTEVWDFFHYRRAKWPQDPTTDISWPFTEWVYPQPLNGNMVSVSVASHPALPFSFSLSRGHNNWGRGYDVKTGKNVAADIYRGTFFQSQWDTVFAENPEIVFITGWNEWIAGKFTYSGEYMFCDNVDLQYSRDIEPMVGGYEDAYYIQMMINVRNYKFNPIDGYIADSTKKEIDIYDDISQWDDVNAIYRNINIANIPRDFRTGCSKGEDAERYTLPENRNNIEYVKVTCDDENLYFLVKCDDTVVFSEAANWMNIFIGTGEKPSMDKGWESYEYVVNRTHMYDPFLKGERYTDIEKISPTFTGDICGEATYFIRDDYIQFAVPRDSVGLEDGGSFYFKVADGVENYNDIMSYYNSGCSMPVGRLSYLYQID